MDNKWINHVKAYRDKHNISYKEALTLAKPSYQRIKNVPTKKQKGQGLTRAGEKSKCK
jgi:hypothetical protein